MKVESNIRPEYVINLQGMQLVSFNIKEIINVENGLERVYYEYDQIKVDPTFSLIDIDKQVEQFNRLEALSYLASTGWYVERLNDPSSGKAIPEDVLAKRVEARELINTLEAELEGVK